MRQSLVTNCIVYYFHSFHCTLFHFKLRGHLILPPFYSTKKANKFLTVSLNFSIATQNLVFFTISRSNKPKDFCSQYLKS